jgi:hypothetical protein
MHGADHPSANARNDFGIKPTQLDLADACVKSCDLAERKLVVIDQKMAELAAMRRALSNAHGRMRQKVKARRMSDNCGLQREPGQS